MAPCRLRGLKEIHVRRRRAATAQPRTAGSEHRHVARRSALETAVVDDIGVHELERSKPRHAGTVIRDTLDGLQRLPVVSEVGVVGDEQVGTIRLPGLRQPGPVHRRLHGGGAWRQTVARERETIVLPKQKLLSRRLFIPRFTQSPECSAYLFDFRDNVFLRSTHRPHRIRVFGIQQV